MRDLDNDFADPNAKDIGNIPEVEMKKKYIIEWSELNAAELSLIPGVEESDKLWDVDVHAKPNIPGTRSKSSQSTGWSPACLVQLWKSRRWPNGPTMVYGSWTDVDLRMR